MPTSAIDWTSGAVVLVVGLMAGLVAALRLRAVRASAVRSKIEPTFARDLLANRDVLVHQLQELEDMAGKKTPAQLAEDRYALELRLARVLMDLDDRSHAVAPKAKRNAAAAEPEPTAAPGWLAQRPALHGFLWGVGAMVAVGGLVFSVRQAATTRSEGGSLTGSVPGEGASAGEAPPPGRDDEARLRAAIERNPDDLDSRIALAQIYLGRQEMMPVWNETKAVLERSPGHPQATAYQALVRAAMGQGDIAQRMLEEVVSSSPDVIEGYVHLAFVHASLGHLAEADAVIARAERRFPARAAGLQGLRANLHRKDSASAGPGGAPSEGAPHPAVSPVGGGGAPAPRSGTAASVEGVVDLDPSLRGTVGPGAVLYVFVREAGFGAGPPVAAKQLPATFPAAFHIDAGDAMMGQSFPDSLLVEARLDSDGDPTTRPKTDPKARQDDVKAGRKDVRLVLTRP